MNNEEKHCIMDDTEKPVEITEKIEELILKGMETVQKNFPSLFQKLPLIKQTVR